MAIALTEKSGDIPLEGLRNRRPNCPAVPNVPIVLLFRHVVVWAVVGRLFLNRPKSQAPALHISAPRAHFKLRTVHLLQPSST